MSDFINSTINTKIYNMMSDEHQIITITDKQAVVENIGTIVSGDTNSCLLTFEINRFQDGIDLSDKKIRFNYRNSNGKFYDVAVNVKYNDDIIRFSWLLPYSLTQPGCNVIASIEFYGYIEYDEEYSYKTKNFKLSVEKSLGVNDEFDKSYSNWAIRIENDVETIQKKISEIEKEVKSIHVPTKLSEMDDDTEHRTVSDSQIQAWNEAQKNAQSDWNEKDTNSGAYIKNKPSIPNVTNDLTDELKSNYDKAVTNSHVHNNKSVIDAITDEKVSSWDNKSEFDGQYSSLKGIPDDIATKTYVNENIKHKVNEKDLSTVAKSGSYNDLKDIPDSMPASDVYQWAKQPQKPSYTASEVGADEIGTAESKVSVHNVSTDTHNDIRLLIQGLTERLDALADSDDETLDQMSEVVAYIKSNKSLIDAITTSKVSVSDIIDNLTTNVSNKPLSAAQGVALKKLIDAIIVPTKLSELENDSGYAKTTDIPDKLPNPQKLTFAGAVTAEYDGSGAVTVTIPKSSGGTIDDSVTSPEKTWSSQKISDELSDCVKFVKIAINLIGSEGNIPLGNTVYVYETVNEIETLFYSVLCPDGTITVRVPHGIQYRITASTDAEGFYAPTEVTGVAINNSEATIRYTELAYPKTIRDLQTLAKMRLAADVVAIGDEFTTSYTYDGNEFEMPWIVTDIKDVEFEDGSTGQGVYLEAKYCTIESIQFDAPHQEVATEETAIEGLYYIGRTDSTYTLLTLNIGDTIPYSDYTYVYHDTIRDTSLNIYRYGHNRVQTSALRQWLNSDADKGAWWTAPKTGYLPPSQLNSQKGFMAGLSQEFLDCVAKVKRTYYTNSVTDGSVIDVLYDKFFSATGTELYGSVNNNEGTYFPYYKEVTGLSAPSNNQNTGRIKYALNAKTSSQYCWAFSSYRGYSYFVWTRYASGQLYNSFSAYYSFRAVPACVIG